MPQVILCISEDSCPLDTRTAIHNFRLVLTESLRVDLCTSLVLASAFCFLTCVRKVLLVLVFGGDLDFLGEDHLHSGVLCCKQHLRILPFPRLSQVHDHCMSRRKPFKIDRVEAAKSCSNLCGCNAICVS